MAWALGLLSLLVLAGPVALFTDLGLIASLSARADDPPASTEAGPAPTILWLELSGLHGRDRAAAVRDEFGRRGLVGVARKTIGADGMFIILYAAWLSIACQLVGRAWALAGRPLPARILVARGAAALVLLAAALDIVENAGMLAMLRDPPELDPAVRTGWCAALKFASLLIVLGTLAVGGLLVPFRSSRRDAPIMGLAVGVGLLSLVSGIFLMVLVGRAWRSLPG